MTNLANQTIAVLWLLFIIDRIVGVITQAKKGQLLYAVGHLFFGIAAALILGKALIYG